MKNLNLTRTMNASPFINQLSDGQFNNLYNYYLQLDIDLNEINVDNDIVNGLY